MNPFTPLGERLVRDEEMDASDLPDDRYARVLAHLARVNLVTLAQRPTLAFVRKVMDLTESNSSPLRLLDVGFGQGDMLRAIGRLARSRGREIELVGVDLNPRSAMAAKAAADPAQPIDWITGDYQDLAGQNWDMVISSLVAHHMSDPERLAFLCFMESEARRGWLINDLHRQRLPFIGYPLLARLLLVDPIVRRDGQLSIARSFRADEWRGMLARADINEARVRRWFPWRLCVERIHR
jgi:2-polyprenyl-3-methyl-5-hydroxy-6-metoxy-1,4-benzoquinol methylase